MVNATNSLDTDSSISIKKLNVMYDTEKGSYAIITIWYLIFILDIFFILVLILW